MKTNQISRLVEAGIVGAGGAGFPTHIKLNAEADVVLINGAECEPLLRVDQQLMQQYPGELLEALELAMEQVGAQAGIVVLKEHYHGAVEALKKELPGHKGIRIHLLGNFYPAGDEQVLVYEATGRIIPEGGIPLQVGAVVLNVETALNMRNAILYGTPVTHKYVTVTGAVEHPGTFFLPVGISIREALALAGGPTIENFEIINGGPMMGTLTTEDSPITKTTKGLIVLPEDHLLFRSLRQPLSRSLHEAGAACMQCSMCTVTCPRGLLGHRIEPHKLMRIAAYGKTGDAKSSLVNAFLCCGCRLCEYSCVMGLQPWKLNQHMKEQLIKNGIKNSLHNQPENVDPFRLYKRYPIEKLIRQLGLYEYQADAPVDEKDYIPHQVSLLLRQGAGVPAVPVIQPGDRVSVGTLLATVEEGKLGSRVHASMNGIVKEVTEREIILSALPESISV